MARFSLLTLRLAVYTLFGKVRSYLGKNFLHPQKYALPYGYVSGTSGNYIRAAWNWAKTRMPLASRGLATPGLESRHCLPSFRSASANAVEVHAEISGQKV